MNKDLHDLTVEEFTRALLDYPEVYEIEITSEDGEKDTVKGTYEQLMSVAVDTGIAGEKIKRLLNGCFDYDITLDNITIYDYLDYKTKGFENERVRAVLHDMDFNYFMIREDIETDIYNKYQEEEREIPTYTTEIRGNNMEFPNFDKMINEAYPCWDFLYHESVGLLKSKLTTLNYRQQKRTKTIHTFNFNKTKEEMARIFQELVKDDFINSDCDINDWLCVCGCDVDVPFTPLVWMAKNKRSRQPSKKSLLDFLLLMGAGEKEIRSCINGCFKIDGGKAFRPQDLNYRNWNTDIKSEYHSELEKIVKNI